jgi:proline iminopeptidase
VPGARLSWVAEGSGPTILCIGSPPVYRRMVPQALRDHAEIVFTEVRMWAPTSPGFDVGTVTLDTYAADLEAVRRDVGAQRVIAMGQSIHGVFAREYARRYPGSALGVMDLNSTPGGDRGDFWERDASHERKTAHAHNLATRPITSPEGTGEQTVEWYFAYGAQHWFDPTFDCRPIWEGVAETINSEQFDRLDPLLEGYQTSGSDLPTYLCLGRYDYVFPYPMWDPYLDRYANLTRRLYQHSAHHPMSEQPEEFVADVVAWLATIG